MNEHAPNNVPDAKTTPPDEVDDSRHAGDPSAPTQSNQAEPISDNKSLMVINKPDSNDGWLSRFLVLLGLRSGSSLREDLHEALSGEGSDAFSPEERAMLQNILRLRERRVEDVMVPRAEVHAVDINTSLGELLQTFEETGHSRLPVYDDTLDDPRGMVLIKDLLLYITKISSKGSKAKQDGFKPLDLTKIDLSVPLSKLSVIRSVLFVPPSMMASELMAYMQLKRTQMALVIDEYGGTDGLVSLEDIVEEVVGEIEDEHDEDDEAPKVINLGEGIWEVDARAELEKVSEEIGGAFDPSEHQTDVGTVGGLVFNLAGHVPVRGEVVSGLRGFEFRVLDADPRRVKKLQIVQISMRDKRRRMAQKSAETENG